MDVCPHAGCVESLLVNTPDVTAVPGSCNLRKDVAFELSDTNRFPLVITFPGIEDLAPPFCFSTIFDLDLMNGTNELDTIVSLGFRPDDDPQTLNVPFKVRVGPSVQVTYLGGVANFPYVARLGKGVFSYLTVCVEQTDAIVISAYIRGCEASTLTPQRVNITEVDIPLESTFVYLGEDQVPFKVSVTYLS